MRTLVQKLRTVEQFLARGERSERCRWQIQRAERVAAVDKIEDQRKPDDFIGHRNRKNPLRSDCTRRVYAKRDYI